jgi:ParB-like chromosome segregation protein Spo0J
MADSFEYHSLADIFPLMDETGAEFTALVEDIKTHGLREPIVIHEGKILDGRNRYRACLAAHVAIKTREYERDDPLAFVISANQHRRHLKPSQSAMAAARVENMPQGRRTDLKPNADLHEVSRADAAKMFSVSERSVASAATVLAKGVRELVQAVDYGDLAVSRAAEIAEMSKAAQRSLIKSNWKSAATHTEREAPDEKDQRPPNPKADAALAAMKRFPVFTRVAAQGLDNAYDQFRKSGLLEADRKTLSTIVRRDPGSAAQALRSFVALVNAQLKEFDSLMRDIEGRGREEAPKSRKAGAAKQRSMAKKPVSTKPRRKKS